MSNSGAIESILAAAVRAPSSHNTQPWRFACGEAVIDLIADRTRSLPVNDPRDRELTISCGCALLNIEVAAAALGYRTNVALAVDDPDRLARVSLTPGDDGRSQDERAPLAASIRARHTHRAAIESGSPDPALRARLTGGAKRDGVRLQLVDTCSRDALAELVEAADIAQWADPHWRRELAAWMHPRRSGDGLTVPALAGPAVRRFVQAADMGRRVARRDRAAVLDAPFLAVLCTTGDERRDWLTAGRALQRLLLEAAAAGFQAAYYNAPLQVSPLRSQVIALCAGATPQLIFRLGRPSRSAPATPRRPLNDVIQHTPGA